MKFEIIKGQKAESVDDAVKKLADVVDHLNATKEAPCWVCQKIVKNWGVLLPHTPDGLGLGSKVQNGEEATRLAFFPHCVEHDLNDEEIADIINMKLATLRSEFTN